MEQLPNHIKIKILNFIPRRVHDTAIIMKSVLRAALDDYEFHKTVPDYDSDSDSDSRSENETELDEEDRRFHWWWFYCYKSEILHKLKKKQHNFKNVDKYSRSTRNYNCGD